MSQKTSLLGSDGESSTPESAYKARLARARSANLNRRQSRTDSSSSALSPENSLQLSPRAPSPARSASKETPRPTPAAASAAFELLAAGEAHVGAYWSYSEPRGMLGVVDRSQLLRIIDKTGQLLYRVQLPAEGTTIFLGWEKSGAVLAAVQRLGGAFLWFPARPENVQQWEGMQFSTKVLKNSLVKRNSHFDTCFACWSDSGKLMLGLADGNFAIWDLGSNQTFMSRTHFPGKHRNAITCGAWTSDGTSLALGSATQLKVSAPIANASWEGTAAKLDLAAGVSGGFQQVSFSSDGRMLSAFAGSSVFRSLGIYSVKEGGVAKNGAMRVLTPVGEVKPSPSLGSLQAALWLGPFTLAVVCATGRVKLLQYLRHEDFFTLTEESCAVSDAGVVAAVLLATGHVAIAHSSKVLLWDPVRKRTVQEVALPKAPKDVRLTALEHTPDLLLVSRSDGSVLSQPLPLLEYVDLQRLVVGDTDAAASEEAAAGLGPVQPSLLMEVSAAEGASSRPNMTPLAHCYSPTLRKLAVVNSDSKLLVFGADKAVLLQNPLPLAACVYLRFDPRSGKNLAVALRGSGVALWNGETSGNLSMWTGMTREGGLFKRSSAKQKDFDPTTACWSMAGQLAVGMQDGSFAVWDSVSSQVSTSGRSGKHSSPVTAGDWRTSLFAPALALASTSIIKVSRGFESAEWGSTALKLKLPKRSAGGSMKSLPGRTKADVEGLHFSALKFSGGGRHLAVLAAPTSAPRLTQVILYEIQAESEALVASREYVGDGVSGAPFDVSWSGGLLVIFSRTDSGGSIRTIRSMPGAVEPSWPPDPRDAPGPMTCGAVSPRGMVAAAFACGERGEVLLFGLPALEPLGKISTPGVPSDLQLHAPTEASRHTLSVAFDGGGVQVWEV